MCAPALCAGLLDRAQSDRAAAEAALSNIGGSNPIAAATRRCGCAPFFIDAAV